MLNFQIVMKCRKNQIPIHQFKFIELLQKMMENHKKNETCYFSCVIANVSAFAMANRYCSMFNHINFTEAVNLFSPSSHLPLSHPVSSLSNQCWIPLDCTLHNTRFHNVKLISNNIRSDENISTDELLFDNNSFNLFDQVLMTLDNVFKHQSYNL